MTDQSTAGPAAAAAIVAYVLAIVGVHPQAIIVALCGCVAGVALAPKYGGRFLSIAVFFSVAIGCAHVATLIALRWFDGDVIYRNAGAFISGFFFHPASAWALKALPGILDRFSKRTEP